VFYDRLFPTSCSWSWTRPPAPSTGKTSSSRISRRRTLRGSRSPRRGGFSSTAMRRYAFYSRTRSSIRYRRTSPTTISGRSPRRSGSRSDRELLPPEDFDVPRGARSSVSPSSDGVRRDRLPCIDRDPKKFSIPSPVSYSGPRLALGIRNRRDGRSWGSSRAFRSSSRITSHRRARAWPITGDSRRFSGCGPRTWCWGPGPCSFWRAAREAPIGLSSGLAAGFRHALASSAEARASRRW
jgi:hypothetical protein